MRASPESLIRTRLKTGLGGHAPTAKRAKRRITTFSPVVPERFARSSSIVLPLVLVGVDVRLVEQHDVAHPRLELALGDLRADVLGLVGGLLLEDAQLGVLGVLRDLVLGDVLRAGEAAMCIATSRANARKSSLRATKSVLQSTSTSTPTLPLEWM